MESESERVGRVLAFLPVIRGALTVELDGTHDPVARRRLIVRQAQNLRKLADELDQHGFLTE